MLQSKDNKQSLQDVIGKMIGKRLTRASVMCALIIFNSSQGEMINKCIKQTGAQSYHITRRRNGWRALPLTLWNCTEAVLVCQSAAHRGARSSGRTWAARALLRPSQSCQQNLHLPRDSHTLLCNICHFVSDGERRRVVGVEWHLFLFGVSSGPMIDPLPSLSRRAFSLWDFQKIWKSVRGWELWYIFATMSHSISEENLKTCFTLRSAMMRASWTDGHKINNTPGKSGNWKLKIKRHLLEIAFAVMFPKLSKEFGVTVKRNAQRIQVFYASLNITNAVFLWGY